MNFNSLDILEPEDTMMINITWGRMMAMAVLPLVLIGHVESVAAADCSQKSLKGAFGVKFDGHSEKLGRISAVGLWTFNGKGGFTATEKYGS